MLRYLNTWLVFRINLVTSHLHFTPLDEYCHNHQFLYSLRHVEEPDQIWVIHPILVVLRIMNKTLYTQKHIHIHIYSNNLICYHV